MSTRRSAQQTKQLAALEQRFDTLLPDPNLPSGQAEVGNRLKQLVLDLFSLNPSQDLPQGLEAQLSTNNVVFPATRLSKWNSYVAEQIRLQDDAKKSKTPRGNNQRMKKDMIAAAAPLCEAFFQATSTVIARETGVAAASVDCSDAFDSIYNASSKANRERQKNKKVDEAVAAHDAVVEFEANNDMSCEENQAELNNLMMVREELSSKSGVCVFDGITLEQLVAEAIEKHELMLVPMDPNTDYGPGLDRQRELLQASIDKAKASAANMSSGKATATAKKIAPRRDDSDDDSISLSSDSGASGMSIAMKMESTSTHAHQPMTVVSTGTSRKKTFPYADEDATVSSCDMDKKSSPLLRKKPFPNENSSNFNVSLRTQKSTGLTFGESDDSDNEKIYYRRSSTSTKNKSILDSDDEELPPMKTKKRARSTNKKRKKLGEKYGSV